MNEYLAPVYRHLELYKRVERTKARDDQRQNVDREILRKSDSDDTGKRRSAQSIDHFIIEFEHLPGISESNLSLFGEKCLPALLPKERYSYLVLKALHLQTDCRWCASESLRSAAKTAHVLRESLTYEGCPS